MLGAHTNKVAYIGNLDIYIGKVAYISIDLLDCETDCVATEAALLKVTK